MCRLRDHGIPIAVASNSPRRFVDAALRSAALDYLFTVVITADDVDQAKPAPDLYLQACAELSAEPAHSVAFEDSRTGAASARAAGLFVVGVPSAPGGTLDADALYGSLADPGLQSWAGACTSPACVMQQHLPVDLHLIWHKASPRGHPARRKVPWQVLGPCPRPPKQSQLVAGPPL